MSIQSQVINKVEEFVTDFFQQNMPEQYVYHDFEHTRQVVDAVNELSVYFELSDQQKELLQIAAWFHDTGYTEGPKGHEERLSLIHISEPTRPY